MQQRPSCNAPAKPKKLTIGVLYGFRALMALFVCNYHIWQLGWLPQYFYIGSTVLDFDFWTRSSYLFVDGMLLMSGFLLFLPYAREKAEGIPVPSVGKFYANRLIRIVPSYLLSILLILALIALPQGAYRDHAALGKDISTHLTFTFNFWPETYLYTPLNGALWTVAVEMQFYLIFPLLARATQKKPVLTLSLMAAAGLGFRLFVYHSTLEKALMVNQMPAFLDVYALGMLGAIFYAQWHQWEQEHENSTLRRGLSILAVPLFILACYGVGALLRVQSTQGLQGVEQLRLSQLMVRLPFALCILWAMLSAAVMPRILQKLLDNRLMRFLATISYNLYIWHQVLSAQISHHLFPDTLHSDRPLQQAYTLLCFCVSIVVAMAATYGVELPAAKGLKRLIEKRGRKKQYERPTADQAEPPTDPVLLRAKEGRTGAD